jgi:hypothetical protein
MKTTARKLALLTALTLGAVGVPAGMAAAATAAPQAPAGGNGTTIYCCTGGGGLDVLGIVDIGGGPTCSVVDVPPIIGVPGPPLSQLCGDGKLVECVADANGVININIGCNTVVVGEGRRD